jgi:glycosyltransferase involved in cell wall biosynthesis
MNGLVVSPKADAIALAASDMFDDEGKWWKMSEYARSFAKQYDWEVIAAMFEEVLRKVVE